MNRATVRFHAEHGKIKKDPPVKKGEISHRSEDTSEI
jgi:hypothetical protein